MSRGQGSRFLSGAVLIVTLLATIGPATQAVGDGFEFLWPGGIVGILIGLCLVQAFFCWRGRGRLRGLSEGRDRGLDQASSGPPSRRVEPIDHRPAPRLGRPSVEPKAAFAERLRDLRSSRGLTQEDLAQKAAIHPTQLARMERDAGAPRLTTIVHLAHGLGIEPSELLVDP